MSDEDRNDGSSVGESSVAAQTVGRLRPSSIVNATARLLKTDPQPGMWAATGTAIAHAPNITDLRHPVVGGDNITFDTHGHSARDAHAEELKQQYALRRSDTQRNSTLPTFPSATEPDASKNAERIATSSPTPSASILEDNDPVTGHKAPWTTTVVLGLKAFWKFFITPTGFLITIYGLNVVAWGAMLFFLELKAAPAMNHPDDGDADSSPRKIWLEIDSQILNALFCLTAWGLAPWRFRDLWWLGQFRFSRNTQVSRAAIRRLAARNSSWFRMRERDREELEPIGTEFDQLRLRNTFSGALAPATASWKIDFVVWMMVLNSLFQVGMAFMMWHYNRIDRPVWGAGLFIGLGCAASMFSGIMCWWEGRKIKKIEGPKVLPKT